MVCLAVIVAAAAAIIILISTRGGQPKPKIGSPPKTTHSAQSPPASPPSQSVALAHIFIIVEENQPAAGIVGNSNAPYINSLIKKYSLASNYHAVAHPSLPNYLALTSGSSDGITNDCNPPSTGCKINAPNIADEIEKSGRTWKQYAESMPSNCYAFNSGRYATKHNPFVYYKDIINNSARCHKHVVPFSGLTGDLGSLKSTPNYAFITPNLCNDMHNCSVATGDKWLAKYVPEILKSQAFTKQNSLLVITWDEGNASTNHVAAVLAGSAVKKGYLSSRRYNHYSLLHTIETVWSLSPLTNNDQKAPIMTEFLQSKN